MSRPLSDDYPGGRRIERIEVGQLPRFAVTRWMHCDATCGITIEEDTCGNLATEETDPEYRIVRDVETSHKVATNWDWAKEEIRKHNVEHPLNPWIIRHAKKRPEFICICLAVSGV